ncbi:uncharacterized protein LOC122378811 isoform X1 [Amphibalanus amphitrite]|uniref:uncharacterized protein LOC122378811 isoform X1 n=1 Tax=Amphibalanus amphitrite TaxID=1232801 RepID=UPI001C8FE6AA|nr:uncharacterized protein LOC122378811 isoform X1 [Amphibalanus amphitrite]
MWYWDARGSPMLVTLVPGAVRLMLLLVLVSESHQSPAKHRSKNIVRLLNTAEHHLDDAAIWQVAEFLSNYTSLPTEDALDISVRRFIAGPGKSKAEIISHKSVPVKSVDSKQGQLKLTIEKVPDGPKPHRTSTKRPPVPDPAGMAPNQKKDEDKAGNKGGKKGDRRSAKRSPRSADDPFYFLHHLRPDLPALDRVLAEEPPEEQGADEVPSTVPPPTPGPPAVSEGQHLQTLLRAMVVYGEAAEGDEGTLSAVRQLVEDGVATVEPLTFRKGLSNIVEDKSILKNRRRREARSPDMSRFTDFMGRERYSQELINSFQPGGKRHLSIKKELREPIDVDLAGVAVMSASLRKRSAPETELPSAGLDEQLSTAEVDGVSLETSRRAQRGGGSETSGAAGQPSGGPETSGAAGQPSAATHDRQPLPAPAPAPARRRRSAPGTRRVLDDIRIAPQLPDLMDLDSEDVLESEQSPLLPVLVTSGEEDPLEVTERAALVFEDTGQRETWGPWGRWGPCSVTCGPGQKARYRHCVMGPRCEPGERESDFKPCFRKSCSMPVPDGLVDAFR